MILPPVDGNRRDLGRVLPEHPCEYFQRLFGRHAADSDKRETCGKTLAATRIRKAQPCPGAPVDAQGRPALSFSVMRQSIEESIGGGIVPLTGLTQKRARGGKKYKEIQRSVFEQAMQQPTAHHLGPQDGIQRGLIKLREQSVSQHSRRVYHAANRRPAFGAKCFEKGAQLRFVRHVHRGQVHARSQCFEFPDDAGLIAKAASGLRRTPSRARRQLRATQKNQPAGPLRDHPTGDRETEVA